MSGNRKSHHIYAIIRYQVGAQEKREAQEEYAQLRSNSQSIRYNQVMENCTNNATNGSRRERAAGRILHCPECGHQDVMRSRCFSFVERSASLVLVSPFRCQYCAHRFMAWRVGIDYPTDRIDRREHRRIPVRLSLSFSGGRTRGKGIVRDISMGGCVIESDAPVKVDDIFYLQLYIAEQEPPIQVAALVRSVTARRVGVKFLRAARENKRLFDFLRAQGA